ncbi:dynamin family protein, partial [Xanthomonas citri pv. citri]|nr:dynamin family protein [Xanthomonas citri pv. citri]
HVSPTHFLECTVRPSIISKGQEESITSIFSTADKVKKLEQFDSVIDSLRGFEKLENIPEIGIEKKELNDINLDACVSLALE